MRLIALSLFIASAALGKDPAMTQPATITVHGAATARAEPDEAHIEIGVVTQAKAAKAAAEENARQSEAVARQLKGLVPAEQIRTQDFSINPNFDPKSAGAGAIQSFTAHNTVNVTIGDLSRLSQVIDATMGSGANTIDQLSFSLKEDRGVRGQALRDAAGHAQESAQALAASLNLRLGPVLRVEEGTAPVAQPIFGMLNRAKVATPISTGTIEVRAEVTITYEILK